MKPDTRARTSTVSTAVKRPVYSSHSATTLGIGFATVTAGGDGAEPATGLLSQPPKKCAARQISNNEARLHGCTLLNVAPVEIITPNGRPRQVNFACSVMAVLIARIEQMISCLSFGAARIFVI